MVDTLNIIGGEAVSANGEAWLENRSPIDNSLLSRIPDSGQTDLDQAFLAAEEARVMWQSLEPDERGSRIIRWASALRDLAEELAMLDTTDGGTPLRTMRTGVMKGVQYAEYFAHLQATGETIPATRDNLHLTIRQPYGVVGIILPFNHPAFFAISKTAPALAAGNAVIVKPSEKTPRSASRIAEVANDILGPGVFNVVHGGAPAGQGIAAHPQIWRIHFTGGVSVGLAIQKTAAESGRIKQLTMELGGKNPLIVYPGVDVGKAARAAFVGMNFTRNQGQSCGSTSRLFVHESVHAEFVGRLQKIMEAVRLGDPREDATEMGTLVSFAQQERVLGFIRSGIAEGAKLVTGGVGVSEDLQQGAYVLPTLFDQVTPNMTIAQEEIFGPVAGLASWSDENQLYEMVNANPFGLAAAIYTPDVSQAIQASHRIEAGFVWINGVETRWPTVPFGGWKNSGIGSEHSHEELLSYTRQKAISFVVS